MERSRSPHRLLTRFSTSISSPGTLARLAASGVRIASSWRDWGRGALLILRHRIGQDLQGWSPKTPVVLDLTAPELSRYIYLTARAFHDAGHRVTVAVSPSEVGRWRQNARFTLDIPGVAVSFRDGLRASPDAIYVTDRDVVSTAGWKAVLHVRYDWYDAPSDALALPYPMHPNQYALGLHEQLEALRRRPRSIGVLFSGNADRNAYDAGEMERLFRVTNRSEIVGALPGLVSPGSYVALQAPTRGAGPWAASDVPRAAEEQGVDLSTGVVLLEGWRVHSSEWMGLLAQAAFFIAPPGVAMPHSHNIIESMAVGTIPITNYGHLMKPPLTETEALHFSTTGELADCLRRALDMPETERTTMSAAAASYYEAHLAGEAFGAQVERALRGGVRSETLYVNAEQRTVQAMRYTGAADG